MMIAFPGEMTARQREFYSATEDEVLFGGAAGGGKSHALLLIATGACLGVPGNRVLLLRRTYPELEKSLILKSHELMPTGVAKYTGQTRRWTFANGSILEFGHLEDERSVYLYQSAEYGMIGFDELTHFTEFQYTYMRSRLRSANPKVRPIIRAATNPGGVGHMWVRRYFVDPAPPNTTFTTERGTTRRFIPAFVHDNHYLLDADPDYIRRLEELPENQKRALLFGDWDVFEGQYFSEFRREIHVVEPFEIPSYWRRYVTIDYGLDMCAVLWIALDTQKNAYVYKELYKPNLIISDAAKQMLEVSGDDKIEVWYAPPDLWNRRQETGKSAAEIFYENGIQLTKSRNDRVNGWYAVKEWLKPIETIDEQTGVKKTTAKLRIFSTCQNLIRTLPMLQYDKNNPNDVADEPHELTHAPDALRGFCCMRPVAGQKPVERDPEELTPEEKYQKTVHEITGGYPPKEFFRW